MGHQIIKQPNGKYAIWSTILDDFIYTDLTVKKFEKIIQNEMSKEAERKVSEAMRSFKVIITKLKKGEKPYHQFTMTYEEAMEKRNRVHSLNSSKST